MYLTIWPLVEHWEKPLIFTMCVHGKVSSTSICSYTHTTHTYTRFLFTCSFRAMSPGVMLGRSSRCNFNNKVHFLPSHKIQEVYESIGVSQSALCCFSVALLVVIQFRSNFPCGSLSQFFSSGSGVWRPQTYYMQNDRCKPILITPFWASLSAWFRSRGGTDLGHKSELEASFYDWMWLLEV